jgi:Spermine/spermidine synthase domain
MTKAFLKWSCATVIGALLMPFIVFLCSLTMLRQIPPLSAAAVAAGICFFAWTLYLNFNKYKSSLESFLDRVSDCQWRWIQELPERSVVPCIFLTAALSLYLELSVIRWQAGLFEIFSFYKNFGMLSCFAGLGIGYCISRSKQSLLICTAPLLAVQQLVLISLRYGVNIALLRSIRTLPVHEQLNMGMSDTVSWTENIALYVMLSVVISLTILAFVPIGQLCGQFMSRTTSLKSYGTNLLGSLCGIIMMIATSAFNTPPAIWFAIVYTGLALWTIHDKPSTRVWLGSSLVAMLALCWNVEFGYERVFSPYQLLERGPEIHGWSSLRAAGLYYQRALDLSLSARRAYPDLEKQGSYYDLPYLLKPAPANVAVCGAGLGNDVATALRNGAGTVYAAEIDPCIAKWGKMYHPEAPYSNPRVHLLIDDARAFMRQTQKQFDLIVFGLLDSHTLTDSSSSLRIDSYIYTLESFKDSRAHLQKDGVMALSFAVTSKDLMQKLYRMMTIAFDGHPPVCIGTNYDDCISFFQNKDGTLQLPTYLGHRFVDLGSLLKNTPDNIDCSTDDWPFFYMKMRCWPVSYLPMLTLLVLLTYAINKSLTVEGASTTPMRKAQFFLLGAGFMLIETKAITELGLHFGNTWQITGTVIAVVLILGFLGNLIVAAKNIKDSRIPYALALCLIGFSWYLSASGGFPSTEIGKVETIAALLGPLLFSGMTFSILVSDESDVTTAMRWNLLGAIFGGILEYTAMYTGYRTLYLVATVIYGVSLVCCLLGARFATANQIGGASVPPPSN